MASISKTVMLKLHEAEGTSLVASPQIQKKYKWQTCYPQIAQIPLKPLPCTNTNTAEILTESMDKHFA